MDGWIDGWIDERPGGRNIDVRTVARFRGMRRCSGDLHEMQLLICIEFYGRTQSREERGSVRIELPRDLRLVIRISLCFSFFQKRKIFPTQK